MNELEHAYLDRLSVRGYILAGSEFRPLNPVPRRARNLKPSFLGLGLSTGSLRIVKIRSRRSNNGWLGLGCVFSMLHNICKSHPGSRSLQALLQIAPRSWDHSWVVVPALRSTNRHATNLTFCIDRAHKSLAHDTGREENFYLSYTF